jgi:hypothetical protein
MANEQATPASAPIPAVVPPSRADIINMLRTAQQHHVQLSSMADQKASILIGVNSVVFALVVREPAAMSLPMLVLAGVSSLAALLCMLAVVPMFGGKRVSRTPLNPNLLFFGVFTNWSEAEFQQRMHDMMADDDAMRRAMIRDMYQLGMVLRHKKYRYLGYGYRVFMFGLAASFLAFVGHYLVG